MKLSFGPVATRELGHRQLNVVNDLNCICISRLLHDHRDWSKPYAEIVKPGLAGQAFRQVLTDFQI